MNMLVSNGKFFPQERSKEIITPRNKPFFNGPLTKNKAMVAKKITEIPT